MLHGETVTVLRPEITLDEHNYETLEYTETVVDNVLVSPGSTTDISGSDRPHGTRVAFSLAFPKTYGEPLRGCRIKVRDFEEPFDVIGDPQPNTLSNCPTQWWYTVEVSRADG